MSGEPVSLVQFVTARLGEDEAAANAGARRIGMAWRAEPQPGTPGGLVVDDLGLVGSTGGRYAAEHIARHCPARALSEVAAKRRRLERFLEAPGYDLPPGVHDGRDPDERKRDEAVKDALETEVRDDAAVYAGHPDYRQEWKL